VALKLGLFVNPSADRYSDTLAMVDAAERGGLDLIGIQDHPYQRRFLDTFALIGDLLARTQRLHFFPDVGNLPLRDPALMAKQAASLDVMSGGRFELGLGAGAFWDRIAAMGGPRRSPGESVEALEEAIQIIRLGFAAEESVEFEGRYYRVNGWEPGPPPAHPIRIWLGAYQPRMLRLTGRLADGWIPSLGYLKPDGIVEARKLVDEAASRAGRDPDDVLGMTNVSGELTDGERGDGPLDGPPEHWVETLARWAEELRLGAIILPAQSLEQVERLATEVVPDCERRSARPPASAPGPRPPSPPRPGFPGVVGS
jgi:alkanesulfonate monooxygenase SsuD/methylene tetrahydromethanopterin reductase-like flavin-dependent oxidoreductase (luciferase family)